MTTAEFVTIETLPGIFQRVSPAVAADGLNMEACCGGDADHGVIRHRHNCVTIADDIWERGIALPVWAESTPEWKAELAAWLADWEARRKEEHQRRHPSTPEHAAECWVCRLARIEAQEYGGLAW